MKICPLEAEWFHAERRADGWTDMTKLIVAFRNFANAPKSHIVLILKFHLMYFCLLFKNLVSQAIILACSTFL